MPLLKDEMQQNYGTFSGAPVLIPTLLTRDTDEATRFAAGDSFSVPDSASDSLAVVVGGAAIECFFRLPSIPAAEGQIIGKSGSYALSVTAAGNLKLHFQNGASSVDLVSVATLTPGQVYHVVGVYDGGYTGTPQFGNTTQIANYLTLPGDYNRGSATSDENLQVCGFQVPESGVLTQIQAIIVRVADATLAQGFRAVAYKGTASAPDSKIAEGLTGILYNNPPASPVDAVFPLSGAFESGDWIWLGLVGGGNSGSMMIECEASGGVHAWTHADVSGGALDPSQWSGAAPDTFGTPAGSDAKDLVVYADYTPTARTGNEGHAILYINGLEDSRAAYTAGIADTANALTGPAIAVDLQNASIWNKRLTAVQVAKHYAAR